MASTLDLGVWSKVKRSHRRYQIAVSPIREPAELSRTGPHRTGCCAPGRSGGPAPRLRDEEARMRRAVLGVVGAAAVLTGCATTPVPVPGEAAPVVAVTGSAQSQATSSPTTPTTSPSPTPAPTSRTPQVPPRLPNRYETLAMTGFGASISLPVPAGWTSSAHDSDQRRNTDLVPPQAPDLLLLRIDLTARGP